MGEGGWNSLNFRLWLHTRHASVMVNACVMANECIPCHTLGHIRRYADPNKPNVRACEPQGAVRTSNKTSHIACYTCAPHTLPSSIDTRKLMLCVLALTSSTLSPTWHWVWLKAGTFGMVTS